jgi:hypothetical protein
VLPNFCHKSFISKIVMGCADSKRKEFFRRGYADTDGALLSLQRRLSKAPGQDNKMFV